MQLHKFNRFMSINLSPVNGSGQRVSVQFQADEKPDIFQSIQHILDERPHKSSLLGRAFHPEFAELIPQLASKEWFGYDRGSLSAHARNVTFPKAFGEKTVVTFCPTVTAATLLCLGADIYPDESIVVADTSHINRYELGGVEALNSGVRVETIPSLKTSGSANYGKITPQALARFLKAKNNQFQGHWPRVLSVTNPTEFGTIYTQNEIKDLTDLAHKQGMLVHLDGARLFTLEAMTGLSFKELTTDVGIDMVSLGGSKAGMVRSEAAVFLPNYFQHARSSVEREERKGWETREQFEERLTRRKIQLGFRTGFAEDIPAQFIHGIETKLATRVSQQSCQNAKAFWQQLEPILETVPGAHLVAPVDSNVVLLSLPKTLIKNLGLRTQENLPGNPDNGIVLFHFGFDANSEPMDRIVNSIKQWGEAHAFQG